MYKHDIESYVITIRRKGGAQPVHKIEKPARPAPEPIAVASSGAVPPDGESVSGVKAVMSPLPGVIIAVKVNVGDTVKAGDVVAVLEAMKMENEIQSEYDGTVSSVNVSQGDSVLEGTLLLSLSF